jgi:formate dehydrogenase accessory protein FdhE
MAMSEHDLQVLRALTTAREKHEELGELLDFYHDLFEVQFEAKARLPEPEVRDEMAKRWRLEGGIPQLTYDQLGVAPDEFENIVSKVTDVLVRHNPNWRIEQEARTAEAQVELARVVFETWDTLTTPPSEEVDEGTSPWSDHPAALTVGFALAPYLQRAAEVILPTLDLSLWVQGYCPICGGRPNFALLEPERGARQLMCSRCNGLWTYSRIGCPFCKSREKQSYYPSEDGVYRLYVCPSCHRYLKTMDLREVSRKVFPTVERLVTIGMDLAAQQEGYGD